MKKPGVRLKTVGGPGVRIEWLDWDLIEAEHHRLHPRSSTFEIKTTWTGTAGWNCLTGWAPAGPESRIRPACWMSRATLGRDPPEFEPLDRGRGSLFDHPDDGLTRGRAVMGGVLIAYCLTVSLICQRRLRR
ncbi:MAG: hypothetical protein HYY93_09750 [Planctomycetes bacterium]|nr:hypothetical protein [Planctomycetota bacterium]